MQIARVVQSTSHLDYLARVLDSQETALAPSPADYAFGRFVRIGTAVGIVYNSQLINPAFGEYGPRLTTPVELNAVFSPDFLNEQGVVISILLLGWRDGDGYRQGVPREVQPVNSPVETLSEDDLLRFHREGEGVLRLAYYSTIVTHARLFAHPLLGAVIDQLDRLVGDSERSRLRILHRTLSWQQTVEGLV
jgi:hypothetical protein